MGMNFNAVNVTMFGIGIILLYAAIKDTTPKGVIQNAFTQSAKSASAPAPSHTANGPSTGGSHPRSNFTKPFPVAPVYPSN